MCESNKIAKKHFRERIMPARMDLCETVLLYEDLSSENSRKAAKEELIRVYRMISLDPESKVPDKISSLIAWHNKFLSTDDPRFTPDGRYFGNESYFSKFLYLVRDASFRGTYYIFRIPSFSDPSIFFKAETPNPPHTLFPWTLVKMKSDKTSILAVPSVIKESFQTFDTADDLIRAIQILGDSSK